jgi:hypothetical protein
MDAAAAVEVGGGGEKRAAVPLRPVVPGEGGEVEDAAGREVHHGEPERRVGRAAQLEEEAASPGRYQAGVLEQVAAVVECRA